MADRNNGGKMPKRFTSGKPTFAKGTGERKGGFDKKGAKGDFRAGSRGKKDDYRSGKPSRDGDFRDKKKSFSDDRGYKGKKPAYSDDRDYRGKKPDFNGAKSQRDGEYRAKKPDYQGRDENYRSKKYEQTDREAVEVKSVREDELPFLIMGRNAVREAIKSGRSIDKILVVPEHDGSLGEIISMARERHILIHEERREALDELCMPFGHGEKPGNHQGIVARVPGADYVSIDDILDYAKERGEKPFVLLLDGITDPYNFGSIIRSAECAGVHGIIIPKRRSATLTSSAVKVSAGAASHMRIAKVPNIAGAIDRLQEEGLFIAGTDMEGQSMYETDLKGAMALVIGSEDEGLSQLVAKKCDFIIAAPIKGHIDSLNAAVATAIVMYEKVRQDIG